MLPQIRTRLTNMLTPPATKRLHILMHSHMHIKLPALPKLQRAFQTLKFLHIRVLVELVTPQMFRSLKPRPTTILHAHIRSIITLLVQFLNMRLQLLVRLKPQLAHFTHKVAAVDFDMLCVIAAIIEDHLALQAGRFEVFIFHVVTSLEMHAEVLPGGEFTLASLNEALVTLAMCIFSIYRAISCWTGVSCAIDALQHVRLEGGFYGILRAATITAEFHAIVYVEVEFEGVGLHEGLAAIRNWAFKGFVVLVDAFVTEEVAGVVEFLAAG